MQYMREILLRKSVILMMTIRNIGLKNKLNTIKKWRKSNMFTKRLITKDTYYVGGSDRRIALFENVYPLTNGVSYNSYVIMDKKTCLLDTVDESICNTFIKKVSEVLDLRKLDYLVINHMEPDHSATDRKSTRLNSSHQIISY